MRLKSLIPTPLLSLYHLLLAKAASWRWGNPSERMIVIGVTGTNGKSTTSNFICRILEEAGFRVGLTTTVNFRIAGRDSLNDTKMTMLGRFKLQKMLRKMADAGCAYAVIETSSEGIKQFRHVGINYDIAVFTNLTPEHLESHGGFENYKRAKGKLFSKLSRGRHKLLGGRTIEKSIVANVTDPYADYFLSFKADKKYGYAIPSRAKTVLPDAFAPHVQMVEAQEYFPKAFGSEFVVQGTKFSLGMPGEFNVENALAAIAVAVSQGVTLQIASQALALVQGVPGRMERIEAGQDFTVIVDYAPEPASFRKLYEVIATLPKKRIIHVFGSCGGGRDQDRRPVLGHIAGTHADICIITNEDPYDDEPIQIIKEVAAGCVQAGKKDGENLFLVEDRAEAIRQAIAMAEAGDLVLITGKGAEQAICVAHGKKLPWDDRVKVREAITARSK